MALLPLGSVIRAQSVNGRGVRRPGRAAEQPLRREAREHDAGVDAELKCAAHQPRLSQPRTSSVATCYVSSVALR
jgi:hypothetical protein